MRSHALCKSFRKNKKSAGFDAHMALSFLVKETNLAERWASVSLSGWFQVNQTIP